MRQNIILYFVTIFQTYVFMYVCIGGYVKICVTVLSNTNTFCKRRTNIGLALHKSLGVALRQRKFVDSRKRHNNVFAAFSPFSTRRICSREHKIQLRDWLTKKQTFSLTNHVGEFCVRTNKFA